MMNRKIQIITNQSQKELKEHGSYQFPVLISTENLSLYKSGSFLWHWHPEIEFTLIVSGSMVYQINHETFLLHEGEALFGNSNTLHTGHMENGVDCHYISITFDAKLIYGYEGSLLQAKYVLPLIQNMNMSAIHFDLSKKWHQEIISALKQIYELDYYHNEFCEMEVQLRLYQIWILILKNEEMSLYPIHKSDEKNYNRIKEMLFFIQENYASKMELEDIARHINICKSECCRIFKRYMKVSLFDYLLEYRIEQSLAYIVAHYSITEAALNVGFLDPNYFSKVFRKYKGCAPSKYLTI